MESDLFAIDWATAVGASVAYGRFEIALTLTCANFLTLRWLSTLKDSVPTEDPSHDENPTDDAGTE